MDKNDLATARKLQQKSIDIVKVIIKYGGGVRGGKAINEADRNRLRAMSSAYPSFWRR